MSIHRSLKTTSGALNMHRNVLSRTERIEKLMASDKFDMEKNSALGLVKVRSIKVSAGKKKKAEAEAAEAGAAGAAPGAAGAPAAAGAGAKPGAAGKAAAPAAGKSPAPAAKAGAPAAKDAGAAKKK